MRRTVYITVSVIIVILATGFFYVRGTPHYSLYMLKQAIEKRNPDEAMKYINTDSIVDNLSRHFLRKNGSGFDQEASGRSSLKGIVVDALPEMKDTIRSSIREAIASNNKNKVKNSLDNTPDRPHNVPPGKTAVRLHKGQTLSIGGIKIGNLDMIKIGKISLWDLEIKNDGKTAIVSVKDTPHIKVRMAKTDAGYWQVVEVLLVP